MATPRDRDPRDRGTSPQAAISAVPGLVRIGAEAWVRGALWGVGTAIGAGRKLGGAVVSPEAAARLVSDIRAETMPGVSQSQRGTEGGGRPGGVGRESASGNGDRPEARRTEPERAGSLRERGAELLDRAAEVGDGADPVHPGFSRILDQLAPDEARILKLLVNEGPQGIVYVNRAAPFGIGAREIARRLSMIGREAGCLHPELVPAYLDNLVSLGLTAIRRDPLEDELPYQVIEAQPEVIEAMTGANSGIFRGQVTRRSVHITEFGRTFCQVCFPPEHLTGEYPAIDPDAAIEVAAPERDSD